MQDGGEIAVVVGNRSCPWKKFQSLMQDVFNGNFVQPTVPEIQPTPRPGAFVMK